MSVRNWLKFGLLGIAGCVLATALATPAQAVDPGVAEVLQRLEKLEQQNSRLEQQNGDLKKELDQLKTESNVVLDEEGADPAAGADKKAVQKIVADYLKASDKKKKDDDEKKKKKDEEEGVEVGKDMSFKSSWKTQPYFETADKAFKIGFRGRWQNDWGWSEQPGDILVDDEKLDDGWLMRRARIGVQGTLWEQFDFVAEWEFAITAGDGTFTGSAPREIWMGMHDLPWVGFFRVGNFKEPFGLEQLTSSRFLTFIERSIIDDAFMGNDGSYNPGVMIGRNFADDRACAAIGAFNTVAGDGNATYGETSDGNYAVVGRLTALPIYQHDGRCLVHVGAAFKYGSLDRADTDEAAAPFGTNRYRARPYRIDSQEFLDVTLAGDDHLRAGLEAAAVWGPFSVQGELMYDRLRNARRSQLNTNATIPAVQELGNVDFYGYYAFASYFLTGENRVYSRTAPAPSFSRQYVNSPFYFLRRDPECGGTVRGTGAWEVCARLGYLSLTDPGFREANVGVPPPAGAGGTVFDQTGRMFQYTLGLNWYWNPNMKVQFNYEHLWFQNLENIANDELRAEDAVINDGKVNTFVMRFHFDF
jgi:phosphate-selective porin OprO/OprP